MEKRFTIALVLSLLVLFLYQQFILGPKQAARRELLEAEAAKQEAAAAEEDPGGDAGDPEPAADQADERPNKVDPATASRTVLENDRLRLTFSDLGAVLEEAEVKDFHSVAGADDRLKLLSPSPVGLNAMRLDDGRNADLALGSSLWKLKSADARSVTYELSVSWTIKNKPMAYALTKSFRLPEGNASYLEVEVGGTYVEGGGDFLSRQFNLLVTGGVFQERGADTINGPRSAIYPFEDDVEVLMVGSVEADTKDEDILDVFRTGEVLGVKRSVGSGNRYVADLGSYLGAYFVLDEEFPPVTAAVSVLRQNAKHRVHERTDGGGAGPRTCTVLNFQVPLLRNKASTWKSLLYLGPIDDDALRARLSGRLNESELEAVGEVYDDQLGWARPIGRFILSILRWLYGVVGNWGWAIVLLTLCVRIVLFPVNRKSQAAMLVYNEKMSRLKPKLDALKKKHEGDQRKFAEEQMKLMREHGLGLPLGGCLPIFLQIPIFFGLFSALRSSIDLRQAPWWWVNDLSQPDHLVTFAQAVPNPMSICGMCCPMPAPPITGFHLLPILMMIAWVVNSMLMPRPETSNPQMDQQRKMMMFMPIIFGVFMYSYAAGLSLYWFTSSLFGIVESRVIKKIWPVNKTA